MTLRFACGVLCGFWLPLVCVMTAAAAEPPVNFGRDIQPILSENCFHCHGPDAKHREADLRLDSFAGATATGAVKPGKSAESELILRILSSDPGEVMPPPKSNLKLTDVQKQLLKRWVDEGGQYTKHWSFIAPVRPAVPAVPATARIQNPIDAFVTAKLVAENLPQAAEADRIKLLRRVTLDLTGLPPTPEELDAFLADTSADSYEKAVDRLLESRRYGERMVWEWLDAARYADTNGYQGDPTRAMWYWRDWAIEAFNKNMPFDQFTIEQLAGDLLPNPTREQLIATGFHRNHMINGEGGRIAEESRIEYVQDRVETTGTVWMGLTLTCCRCHDHKYDPFSQKEYYQLSAYFNSIDESGANDAGGLANPLLSFALPEQQKKVDELRVVETEANKARDELDKKVRGAQATWEQELSQLLAKSGGPEWTVLTPVEAKSEASATLKVLEDGSLLASGTNPSQDSFVVTFKSPLASFTGIRLEALPDDSLVNKGPGRADNGNFVLSELKLQLNGQPVELAAIRADFEQGSFPLSATLDGKPETGWAVASEFGRPHTGLYEVRSIPTTTGDGLLVCRLEFRSPHVSHVLGRFRLSVTNSPIATFRSIPDKVREALAIASDKRDDAQRKEISEYYVNNEPSLVAAKKVAEDARKNRDSFERSLPRTMVMRERAQPRETFVLVKGAYNVPSDKVEHGVLTEILPIPADAPKSRFALAQWLVSPAHPLTARVTVNRFWQQFFGTGLVKSTEDFGIQGDRPSHPELLDWLAVEFRESGWNVKHLVKLIVTSAAYRQSSKIAPGMAERDPENCLLARGPRFRLPSWMIRDQALAVSGLLIDRSGGAPVKGYQPSGVWEDATFGRIQYAQDHGEALYRRSLYTFWRRIAAPTVFFDIANRQNCSVKSDRTNTPLHALVTLNDVTYIEAARGLAQRTLLSATSKDEPSRITEMFRRCTCRQPTAKEAERLGKRLAVLRATYGQNTDATQKLLAVGESKPDPQLNPAELAAWTGLANLMLNLDEAITKE
ncbi:MAG: hypothetical protein JWN70_5848 [Planctomycetaceae bacterium]|nr:hypothetical protein [Planctomycetaceae bacterium]